MKAGQGVLSSPGGGVDNEKPNQVLRVIDTEDEGSG